MPIPRFVSLKSSNARMRIGPSTDYGTKFVYKAARLPLEIIEEYDNWRQVRDCDGVTGWMHRSLLSSRRTAIVGPWLREPAAINAQPGTRSDALALLSPRVLLGIKRCDGKWCTVQVFGHDLTGFVAQQALCGVYANEAMD
ncbi:SH3 domain-containing protein [Rhizobium anhuiense]|uniref:SH3 domain-containing protein n=1 Tax=Rhizobium anhuiense TaxID=1184720 RepID=UPI001FDF96E8|nr:SH3 domain-containing protein [Rhizobium anhuiense]